MYAAYLIFYNIYSYARVQLKILLCIVIIASYLYAFLFGYVTFYIN